MNSETNNVSRRAAYWGLGILTMINMVNYIDRFLVPALVESIKHSELQLTDQQLGALGTAFLAVYTLTAPLFGILGDRHSRPKWIAFGVFLWSAATAFSGFAKTYLQLFVARGMVGIGEAAYGTIAPSLLADYFPRRIRGRIFAVFFCAIPIGSAFGYVLGGLFDQHVGWRNAFFICGVPGLVLAALLWWMTDPPRGSGDTSEATVPSKGIAETFAGFLKNKPYVWTVFGYAAYTFAVGGLGFWMPSFLERVRGLPRASATIDFGVIVVITGFVGTFVGGWLGDHWSKTSKQAYLWLSSLTMVLAVPFAVIALMAANPHVYYPAIFIAELLIFMSTGPINSAIINFVAPNERASATALMVFSIHAFGDVWSPWLIGAVSDSFGLATAVLLVPAAIAIGGVLWWHAGRVADRAGAGAAVISHAAG